MNGSILKSVILICMILGTVYLSGCVGQTPAETPKYNQSLSVKDMAVSACKELCESALSIGENLSNGPCLSNRIAEGWVCDVAHSPRLAVDNEPANQCSAYAAGTANHFVEVDANCELIKAL